MRAKGFTLIELLIVVAIIAILAAIAVPNFLEAQVRAKVSRVKSDQRSLATGLEAYYIDNNIYPAQDSSGGGTTSGFGAQPAKGPASLKALPTFRRKQNNGDGLRTLTTPVAYISSYFTDPFARTSGALFRYSTQLGLGREVAQAGWILWSFGPDFDEANNLTYSYGGDIGVVNSSAPPYVQDTFYNPREYVPSPTLLNLATYDPTNGTTSQGDVYRVKQ